MAGVVVVAGAAVVTVVDEATVSVVWPPVVVVASPPVPDSPDPHDDRTSARAASAEMTGFRMSFPPSLRSWTTIDLLAVPAFEPASRPYLVTLNGMFTDDENRMDAWAGSSQLLASPRSCHAQHGAIRLGYTIGDDNTWPGAFRSGLSDQQTRCSQAIHRAGVVPVKCRLLSVEVTAAQYHFIGGP